MKARRLAWLIVAVCVASLACPVPGSAGPALALRGRVLDDKTDQPLADAHVRLASPRRATATDRDGAFVFPDLPDGTYQVEASRIGYTARTATVTLSASSSPVELRLEPRAIPSPVIEVTTTRAQERGSAVAFTDLSRPEIQERYWAQDVPMLLAETPSVYSYSDAGNGIGYSYVKVRGFSQRRVAVTINGIPLNDPESHEVYWVDHPDLVSSARAIQVQRGVGSALYGSSAVGGSINLETLGIPEDRSFALSYGAGSYATRRFSAEYQSGLLDNAYAFSGRYSTIVSNGYRELSWSRLWSYYLSAVRLDSWITSRLNLYGGPERLHLAYYGVDRPYLDGAITGDAKADRRLNPYLAWPDETDNFFEPHYELIHDVKLSDRASLTSSLFYFTGKGYYDDFPYGPQPFTYRGLPNFEVESDSLYPGGYYASDSTGAPAVQPDGRYLVVASDMTQRLWVQNHHYGWIPRARIEHDKGVLTLGGEWRRHEGRHWGELTWAQALPQATSPNHVFYDYEGQVSALSAFAQEAYSLRADLQVTGSLQLRNIRQGIHEDRFNAYDFDLDYTFLNPRLGINWNATARWNLFANYAHTRVEPILGEIYRADDPTAVPLFGTIDVANQVYEDPLVDPEQLNDYEAGAGYRSGGTYLKVTGFWLDFRNEIVPSGQIDRYGVPITGNAARSAHRGIEVEGAWSHASGLHVSGNVSLSRNRFEEYKEYIGPDVFNDYGGNAIATFPDRLANLTVGYKRGGAGAALTVSEVGRQYLDNSEDSRKDPALRDAPGYQRKLIEEHAFVNGTLTLDLGEITHSRPLDARRILLEIRGMNLTNLRYETSGYVYAETPYFFPAALRNVYAGLRAEF